MTALLLLFAWSFLAATVVPVGSEPMLIGLVRSGAAVPLAVAVSGQVPPGLGEESFAVGP